MPARIACGLSSNRVDNLLIYPSCSKKGAFCIIGRIISKACVFPSLESRFNLDSSASIINEIYGFACSTDFSHSIGFFLINSSGSMPFSRTAIFNFRVLLCWKKVEDEALWSPIIFHDDSRLLKVASCPAVSGSKAKMISLVIDRILKTCCSVRAVPIDATTFLNPN